MLPVKLKVIDRVPAGSLPGGATASEFPGCLPSSGFNQVVFKKGNRHERYAFNSVNGTRLHT